MNDLYTKDYFIYGLETGKSLYSDYRWIPELTIPLAYRLIRNLGLDEKDAILDYGCAMGYLVKAFHLLGYNAYGYDISEYALDHVPSDTTPYIYRGTTWKQKKWDWIIAKDVLEHVEYGKLSKTLTEFSKCTKWVFAVIPLAHTDTYNEKLYELDKTHIIRENLLWWIAEFSRVGFKCYFADYAMKGIKENWTTPKANGFFKFINQNI